MTIDKNIVKAKLEDLKHAIAKIESMDTTLEHILDDEDIQDLLDRRMQVAVEACIDIATHIASSMSLPREEHSADVFLLLGQNDVLTEDSSRKLAGAVGLRNIIVHEYADIDYQLAYSNLGSKLEDLKTFAREVLKYLSL